MSDFTYLHTMLRVRDLETSIKFYTGLLGMKERAATIDGTLEVASEPGQGTKVTLRVPIAQSER